MNYLNGITGSMQGISIKELSIGIAAFIGLSFIFKLAILTGTANLIYSFFPDESLLPIYVGVAISILLTGLVIGKFIHSRIQLNPLTHALIIALIAATYKLFRPDLFPLPVLLVILFALLNFTAILWGFRFSTSRQQ